MGWFNNAFNFVKNGVRRAGGTVKSIANAISTGSRFFSALPFVGQFAAGLGTVAEGVSRAVDVANAAVNVGEGIQRGFKLDTGEPLAQTAPISQSIVRYPQSVRRVPVRAR